MESVDDKPGEPPPSFDQVSLGSQQSEARPRGLFSFATVGILVTVVLALMVSLLYSGIGSLLFREDRPAVLSH